MQKRAPSAGMLAIAAGFALSCFGLLLFLWISFGGSTPFAAKSYRITAFYPEAALVVPETDVRISGVNVGRVAAVDQEEELTRVEIELASEYAPISADTETILRRKTLLGEAYVELIPPGDEGPELPDGGSLAVGQTKDTTELDEFLRIFDPTTRRQMRLLLGELATAVRERGADFNAALGHLRPVTDDGADVVTLLASQRRALRELVRNTETVTAALSERTGALRTLVEAGAEVFDTTASRNRELTETVRLLPPLLTELRPTLALARQVGLEAEPVLDDVAPVADQIAPTLIDLRATAPQLRRLFGDLDPAIRRARRGLPALTSLLRAGRPLARRLDPALRELVPAVDWLIPYRRELAAWAVKLAAATQATAGQGANERHVLRVVIPLLPEGLALYQDRAPTNRHNAYAKPGYLDRVGNPHPLAFDCGNAIGNGFGIAPPCVEQGPFSFNGVSSDFPQVKRAAP